MFNECDSLTTKHKTTLDRLICSQNYWSIPKPPLLAWFGINQPLEIFSKR